MTGILVACALFGALAATASAMTRAGTADAAPGLDQRRLPDPGARDLYAVTGALGRAHVPSWT